MNAARLISDTEFGRLRLRDLLAGSPELTSDIHEITDWEFMGALWLGERVGVFTDFLRPEQRPEELGAICLHVAGLPVEIGSAILDRIGLPLRHGMTRAEIEHRLGEPAGASTFVSDRITLEYRLGDPSTYLTDLTIHADEGLIHVSIVRADLLALVADD